MTRFQSLPHEIISLVFNYAQAAIAHRKQNVDDTASAWYVLGMTWKPAVLGE